MAAGVFILILWVALSAAWIWLLLGILKSGRRKTLAQIAIQLSAVTYVYYGLRDGGFAMLLNALVPIYSMISEYKTLLQFPEFLSLLLPFISITFLVTFTLCIFFRRLRIWSFGIATITAMLVAVPIGEKISQHAMCKTAFMQGVSQIKRNTFSWSLLNAPDEWQFEIHATTNIRGKRYGWSYRDMNWYEIKPGTWGEVKVSSFDDCQN